MLSETYNTVIVADLIVGKVVRGATPPTLSVNAITAGTIAYTSANLSLGLAAGLQISSGSNHIALGSGAGTVVNVQPLRYIPSLGITAGNASAANIAIGSLAGDRVYGAENIALGVGAGNDVNVNTTTLWNGGRNVAVGYAAGSSISGATNIAIGLNAGAGVNGYNNVAIGQDTLTNYVGNDALHIQCKALFIGDNGINGVPSNGFLPHLIPDVNALKSTYAPVSDAVLIQRLYWLLNRYGLLSGAQYPQP